MGGHRRPEAGLEARRRLPHRPSEHILDTVFKVVDKLNDTGPLLNKPLELVYDVLVLTYDKTEATGPLRNMLPVDRRAPLRVAMAEWSFRPDDLHRSSASARSTSATTAGRTSRPRSS